MISEQTRQQRYAEEALVDALAEVGGIPGWELYGETYEDLLHEARVILALDATGPWVEEIYDVSLETPEVWPLPSASWQYHARSTGDGCRHVVKAVTPHAGQLAAVAEHRRGCLGGR